MLALFERIIQAFQPPKPKKRPARMKAHAQPGSKGGERRKKSRTEGKERRGKLRIQDWSDRDTLRRKHGDFRWEGF